MNNLYGWAMSECLPYSLFKWLKNVGRFDVNSIGEKSPKRYFLEDDLEYPDELQFIHLNILMNYNNYPFAPEKLSVSSDTKA